MGADTIALDAQCGNLLKLLVEVLSGSAVDLNVSAFPFHSRTTLYCCISFYNRFTDKLKGDCRYLGQKYLLEQAWANCSPLNLFIYLLHLNASLSVVNFNKELHTMVASKTK